MGNSLPVMTITIHSSFLPHTDPQASLAFYRDVLGFEVRLDVGYEGMRWLTVGPPNQPDTNIVLTPVGADPGVTDAERTMIGEMMAKGTFASINLAVPDLDGDALLMQLDLAGVCASLGSACASGSTRPSPTLVAMRVPDDRLRSSVRFSLGAATTAAEIEAALPRIVQAVHQARALTRD